MRWTTKDDTTPATAMDPPGERINLLQFVTSFHVGGTERQVTNLVHGMDHVRFKTHLGCLHRVGGFLADIEREHCPIVECTTNSFFSWRVLKAQMHFARFLRKNRIQLVHTFGFYPNVFALPAARLQGIPIVIGSVRDMGDPLTPAMKQAMKVACSFAHCITTNAEAIKKTLIGNGYSPDKIRVIPNGIAVERYARHPGSFTLHRDLGLAHDVRLVGVVSRVIPLKGMEYFLDAVSIVSGLNKNLHFVIIGAGDPQYREYGSELQARVERLGLQHLVTFLGNRLDIPIVLHELTVSVLPSLSEGLSNTLLESMAAGVPVVATRVGGNPEVVEDGVTGLLVEPRDPLALADAIHAVLTNHSLAQRLSAAARASVSSRFSIGRVVRQTEELYIELLEQAGALNHHQAVAS